MAIGMKLYIFSYNMIIRLPKGNENIMPSRDKNTPKNNGNNQGERDLSRRRAYGKITSRKSGSNRILSTSMSQRLQQQGVGTRRRKMDKRTKQGLMRSLVVALVGIAIALVIFFIVRNIAQKGVGFSNPDNDENLQGYATQVPRERKDDYRSTEGEIIAPNPDKVRDISFGAKDIVFKEKQINRPGIFDTEIVFSAGTGSLDGEVLTKLYLYNLDTQTEELITKSAVGYYGEIYETYVNHNWIVWLDTDKGRKNNVKMMNRGTGKISTLRTSENGQPKLRLYGDILVWMEQVSDAVDKLYMVNLNVQEDLTLSEFTDKATYGVSAPCIYENSITWAGPGQDEDDTTSGIYYLRLEADEQGLFSEPERYFPGTYVHEPLYNGDVFVWLDTNKSRDGKLYIGRPGEQPGVIDQNITTYSLGDGVVVYGKNTSVWAYVIATGEICRLTSPGELGILPEVSKRTVVWYNLSSDSDKDVLRYKILTDEELYPGGNLN